jgi:hypothetical protein
MLANAPRLDAGGVPLKRPVLVLNVAHAGLLVMLKVSTSPSASFALGVKVYAWPTSVEPKGLPEIVGAALLLPDPGGEEAGGEEAGADGALAADVISASSPPQPVISRTATTRDADNRVRREASNIRGSSRAGLERIKQGAPM